MDSKTDSTAIPDLAGEGMAILDSVEAEVMIEGTMEVTMGAVGLAEIEVMTEGTMGVTMGAVGLAGAEAMTMGTTGVIADAAAGSAETVVMIMGKATTEKRGCPFIEGMTGTTITTVMRRWNKGRLLQKFCPA